MKGKEGSEEFKQLQQEEAELIKQKSAAQVEMPTNPLIC